MGLFSLTINNTITDIQWQAYPISLFLLLLCLVTIFGNILIIYVTIREETLHTSTYYYIASLALADLIVGLIVMPLAFIFEMTDDERWLFGRHLRFLCDYWHSIDIFASTASILGLCAVGLDRYMAITKSIQYPNSFLSKRWYFVLLIIWLCAAVISFPIVAFFGTTQTTSHVSYPSNDTLTPSVSVFNECEFPDNPYYMFCISIISFYLPLIVLIYVYIQVYVEARKQMQALRTGYKHHHHHRIKSARSLIPTFRLREILTQRRPKREARATDSEANTQVTSVDLLTNRRLSSEPITLRIHHGQYRNPNLDENRNSQKRKKNSKRKQRTQTMTAWRQFYKNQKAAMFIGLIMGAFVICYLPYFVYFILTSVFITQWKANANHQLLFRIFSWLGYANSALDVLIYVLTSKELRTAVWRVLTLRRWRSVHGSS